MSDESDHLPDEELHPYQPMEDDNFSYIDPIAVTPLRSCLLEPTNTKLITLLEKGYNPNVVDNLGNSFIHYAAKRDSLDVITTTKKHSKYPLQLASRNWRGETCLFQALSAGCSYKLVESLVDMDRSLVNIPNNENIAPLHVAVKVQNNEQIVEYLLKQGADLNAIDFDSCTPLHEAIDEENWNIVRLLLFYGVDVSIGATESKVLPFVLSLCKPHTPIDILENVFWLTCGDDVRNMGLIHLELVIHRGTMEMFNFVLRKLVLTEEDVLNNIILQKLVNNRSFSNVEWLQCFYKLMDKEMDLMIIRYSEPFLSLLKEAFNVRQIAIEEGVKLLYALLACSPQFIFADVAVFYKNPKQSPYIEVFINVNPSFSRVHDCSEKECMELCFITRNRHECSYSTQTSDKIFCKAQFERCASLLAIARNFIRELIFNHLSHRLAIGAFDYIHVVRSLELPNSLENILLFKR